MIDDYLPGYSLCDGKRGGKECYLKEHYCDPENALELYREILDGCFRRALRKVMGPEAKPDDLTGKKKTRVLKKTITSYHNEMEKVVGEERVHPWGKADVTLKLRIDNSTYNRVKKIDEKSGAIGKDGSFEVETRAVVPNHENKPHIVVACCPIYNCGLDKL